jgi:RNA polymerase sigma factor (sigma-70 family)
VVENADDLESLNAALEQLTPDERLIIQYRFYQNLTLKECGKHFGYTPEAARQAEQKALARLKSFIGGI